MLPDLYTGLLRMPEQKQIMRRYLFSLNGRRSSNCKMGIDTLWLVFQGGSGPLYQAIERLCTTSPGYAIKSKRMPPGVPIHRDPKHWTRVEFTSYHTHIHKGQRGELPDDEIFQYRLVYPEGSKDPKICLETTHTRDPHSTLKYTCGELLRVKAVAQPAVGAVEAPQWNGLPLTRTSHVYVCFRGDLFKTLLEFHQHHQELRDLLCEVVHMEQFSPLHVSRIPCLPDRALKAIQNATSLGQGPQFRNIHVSTINGTSPSLGSHSILPSEFFDQDHNLHSQ